MRVLVSAVFVLLSICLNSQKFAIIGDYRCGDTNAYNVSLLVKSWNPDFIVTTGDNFDINCNTIDYQIGQYYHEFLYPYAGGYGVGAIENKFFPSLGNHEYNGTGLTGYHSYFELPGNERYYDFVIGDVHFYILNSNTQETDGVHPDSVQGIWFQNALNASISNWNIVVFHHPPYSSGIHGSNATTQWPFHTWGIDAVFNGHEHNYERLFIDNVLYIINGVGGAPLYDFVDTIQGSEFQYNASYGAILSEVYTDSITFSFYNIYDSLVDYYTLIKSGNFENNFLANNNTSVFPNPAVDQLNVKYSVTKTAEVMFEIYHMDGRKIKTLNKSIQPPGKYFIQFRRKDLFEDSNINGSFIFKIVINGKQETYRVVFL